MVVNGDADPPGDQFFPWLQVDARGRLHLLLFDSRHTVQADGAVDGDLDIWAQRILVADIFADGFESGDTGAWS